MRALAASLGLAILVAGGIAHASPEADATWTKLQGLAGAWTAIEGAARSPASFELVARGHALVQRSGFFAIFTRDGDSFLLTLFPDDGSQQRLRAALPDGKQPLDFRFVDATNLAPNQGSMVRMNLDLHDPARVVEKWTWKRGGQVQTIVVTLTRPAPAK